MKNVLVNNMFFLSMSQRELLKNDLDKKDGLVYTDCQCCW